MPRSWIGRKHLPAESPTCHADNPRARCPRAPAIALAATAPGDAHVWARIPRPYCGRFGVAAAQGRTAGCDQHALHRGRCSAVGLGPGSGVGTGARGLHPKARGRGRTVHITSHVRGPLDIPVRLDPSPVVWSVHTDLRSWCHGRAGRGPFRRIGCAYACGGGCVGQRYHLMGRIGELPRARSVSLPRSPGGFVHCFTKR